MITELIMGAFLTWMVGEAAFSDSHCENKDPEDDEDC